jgi:hypothetical protein
MIFIIIIICVMLAISVMWANGFHNLDDKHTIDDEDIE